MDGDDDLFSSPEEAALSSWSRTPSAFAKIVQVRLLDGDTAEIVIETHASNDEYNRELAYCQRMPDGRWWLANSQGQ